jgi:hypothetical protein
MTHVPTHATTHALVSLLDVALDARCPAPGARTHAELEALAASAEACFSQDAALRAMVYAFHEHVRRLAHQPGDEHWLALRKAGGALKQRLIDRLDAA